VAQDTSLCVPVAFEVQSRLVFIIEPNKSSNPNLTFSHNNINNNYVALVHERRRPADRRLSAKILPTFLGQRGVVWSVRRIPYGRNLDF
jgi:hypothetical protein